ncbi:kinase-like protein [Cylindrobasidium torrendii FP15055 ss-10]|uniref:Kinase-like protein n=1 Tax=Cylindrobasidium torrendii FP15055 ss-10 TaxID=1314674 RepID=A0A0D7AW42_9AGAR|nr:kinase-like protein [Cylindrobasidium torrendii FP15055 ss-10]
MVIEEASAVGSGSIILDASQIRPRRPLPPTPGHVSRSSEPLILLPVLSLRIDPPPDSDTPTAAKTPRSLPATPSQSSPSASTPIRQLPATPRQSDSPVENVSSLYPPTPTSTVPVVASTNDTGITRKLSLSTGNAPHDNQADLDSDSLADSDDDIPHGVFFDLSMLSHIAFQVRDRLPKSVHTRSDVSYARAFTGRDLVSTIQELVQDEILMREGVPPSDRQFSTHIARTFQRQLLIHEVQWREGIIQDDNAHLYQLTNDADSSHHAHVESPRGVIMSLSRCYSPSCAADSVGGEPSCYSLSCPRRGAPLLSLSHEDLKTLPVHLVGRAVDILQDELDAKGAFLGPQRSRRVKCMRTLTKHHDIVPSSFFCREVEKQGSYPIYGGGFADIYRGNLGSWKVAIKVLRFFTTGSERDKLLKDCRREALLWRQLDHPNILPFLGINDELFYPSFCLISPWLENGSVNNFLKSNPSFDRMECIIDITRGLHFLHQHDPPIVHGDIRGANILVTDDHRCCLADFGLSTVVSESSLSEAHTSSSSAGLKGTVRWMPPETVNHALVLHSHRPPRDIYSLGCTFLEVGSMF